MRIIKDVKFKVLIRDIMYPHLGNFYESNREAALQK